MLGVGKLPVLLLFLFSFSLGSCARDYAGGVAADRGAWRRSRSDFTLLAAGRGAMALGHGVTNFVTAGL